MRQIYVVDMDQQNQSTIRMRLAKYKKNSSPSNSQEIINIFCEKSYSHIHPLPNDFQHPPTLKINLKNHFQ